MDGSRESNDNYKFVLSIIDCYTKYAWLYKMKRISGKIVVECFRQLFTNHKNIPEKLCTDKGAGKL